MKFLAGFLMGVIVTILNVKVWITNLDQVINSPLWIFGAVLLFGILGILMFVNERDQELNRLRKSQSNFRSDKPLNPN